VLSFETDTWRVGTDEEVNLYRTFADLIAHTIARATTDGWNSVAERNSSSSSARSFHTTLGIHSTCFQDI